jgi:RIO kinase 1
MAKVTREKFKTMENVFSHYTKRNLFKMEGQGHFDEFLGPVSTGKEANVFLAKKGKGVVIVKIYRLETCDFTKMFEYIRTDPRYAQLKKNRRQIIFAWCKREYRNLLKARKAGVHVPTPYAFRDNILIMEAIGGDTPSPMLKDARPEKPKVFLNHILKLMKKMHKAGLTHGDLSSFNILNHNEKPVFIDFSQAVLLSDPLASKLLERDCKNIAAFFKKEGVEVSKEEIKEYVTA